MKTTYFTLFLILSTIIPAIYLTRVFGRKMIKSIVTTFVLTISVCINVYSQGISSIWVNNGEDKVTQDELRAHSGKNVINSVWDGDTIRLFGARNEVVDFNLILEAGASSANNVNVELQKLAANDLSEIKYRNAAGADLYNWTDRQIELFYVRYLEIQGLSVLAYENYYDERHVPERFRRPCNLETGEANAGTDWYNRPDHNKKYPDIAVPIELHPNFTISAGTNQSIWVDIYIPKSASNSNYRGNVKITENGVTTFNIPVVLYVYNFELPDVPTAKTMLNICYEDICSRYTGTEYPEGGSDEDKFASLIRQRHMQLAHRHKISVIDYNIDGYESTDDHPMNYWLPALNGDLFSSGYGYDGPGKNTGNGVFSIGTFGSWSWDGNNKSEVYKHTDNWVNWFKNNSPETDYLLFLIDEPDEDSYDAIKNWSKIIKSNPGPGSKLPIFLTVPLPTVQEYFPDVDISGTAFAFGDTETWEQSIQKALNDPSKRFFFYNGLRPTQGSFATEDDGVAMRVTPWAQYKKKIERWFMWESTNYNNEHGGRGQTDVFSQAQTYGELDGFDKVQGETGHNYNNGDGLLFYPGTDKVFPTSSYNIPGPIASLRLKHWRRGIQDVDYLSYASAIDPSATDEIINHIIPKVFWEYGTADKDDPTWMETNISWSNNPDVWEAARKQLAEIIASHTPVGVNQLLTKGNIKIQCYPNPATQLINFEINEANSSGCTLSVFDISGRKVVDYNKVNEAQKSKKISYDVSSLKNGIYFYRISIGGNIFNGKFIKSSEN